MTIPKASAIEGPLLHALRNGEARRLRDVIAELATHFELTAEDLAQRHATGALKFENLARWARQRLKDDGDLIAPERGTVQITAKGLRVLTAEESTGLPIAPVAVVADVVPEESLDTAISQLNSKVTTALLERLKEVSPQQFERIVVDLLLAMGYGFDRIVSGQVTRYSADGGIDGLVHEDKLGLSTIYVQAKRYTAQNVGRPEVQQFVGALTGAGATKGVFLTSAGFSPDARQFAERLQNQKVVLIDGVRLAQLMSEHDVGVTVVKMIAVKQLDSDYFDAA